MKNPKSEAYKSIELGKNPILRYCKEERSIVQIAKHFNMKRTTLIYYLKLLEKEGVINTRRVKEKMTGRPTLVETDTEKIDELKKQSDKLLEGKYSRFVYEILQILQEKKKALSEDEINRIFINKFGDFSKPPFYVDMKQEHWNEWDDQFKAEEMFNTGVNEFLYNVALRFSHPHIQTKFVLIKGGKKYLQKHKVKHKRVSQK